jgi:hypothetical protein
MRMGELRCGSGCTFEPINDIAKALYGQFEGYPHDKGEKIAMRRRRSARRRRRRLASPLLIADSCRAIGRRDDSAIF